MVQQGEGLFETRVMVADSTFFHVFTFPLAHGSSESALDRVRSLTTDAHGAYQVCLNDGPRVKLNRSYRQAFEEAIATSV